MDRAFDDLARLGAGIQLTPGNHPTRAFREHVERSGVITRRHHSFAWDARKTEPWIDGMCAVDSESVHPPRAGEHGGWYERAHPVVEVMYPGYELGDGDAVERAMRDGLPLAVDISHAFIQRTAGVMTEATWQRLCDYDRIIEVHVSANGGEHDSHKPLADNTFGLAWAGAKLRAGTPTVLECYMHKLSDDDRRRQIDRVRA